MKYGAVVVFWWKACSYPTWIRVECKSPFWAAAGWDFSSCSPSARCAAAGSSEQTSRGWLVPASCCAPQVAPVKITCGLLPAVVGVWKSAAWGMYLSVVDWSLRSVVLVWWIGSQGWDTRYSFSADCCSLYWLRVPNILLKTKTSNKLKALNGWL